MSAWLGRSWWHLMVIGGLSLFEIACDVSTVPTVAPTPILVALPRSSLSILPATTGVAVWDYLQEVNYQETWDLWPGKGELYQGVEPHGMLLTTYLSPVAFVALTAKAGVIPENAIIVKENYLPDRTLDSITVMYKVAEYNPEHNNWFFAKLSADGAVSAEGKVQSCQACHSVQRDNDYIYTGSLK